METVYFSAVHVRFCVYARVYHLLFEEKAARVNFLLLIQASHVEGSNAYFLLIVFLFFLFLFGGSGSGGTGFEGGGVGVFGVVARRLELMLSRIAWLGI